MITTSDLETQKFGSDFAKYLKPGSTVALHGEIGAGKTTLVKGIIAALSEVPPHEIQSPTFTYLHLYDQGLHSICHFDLYRLNDKRTFIEMGFLDFLNSERICLIEWPQIIRSCLPSDTIHIHIAHMAEGKRSINVL